MGVKTGTCTWPRQAASAAKLGIARARTRLVAIGGGGTDPAAGPGTHVHDPITCAPAAIHVWCSLTRFAFPSSVASSSDDQSVLSSASSKGGACIVQSSPNQPAQLNSPNTGTSTQFSPEGWYPFRRRE